MNDTEIKLKSLEKPILFVGIGNNHKGDDGIGPDIIKKIKEAKLPINAIDCGLMPENHFKEIASYKPKSVVFIDAVSMNKEPGSYDFFETTQIENFTPSTHGISIGMIAEYLNTELGAKVYLLGIQPKSLKKGEGLSIEASKAVVALTNVVIEHHLG